MTTKFTDDQIEVLLRPLASARVAKRSIGGTPMSYLMAWDVRAHLIRMFGFGGFDIITHSCDLVYQRDVEVGQQKRPGWEVAYKAHVELRVDGKEYLDPQASPDHRIYTEGGWMNYGTVTYSEFAIGTATGSVGLGDLHDNAAKSAVSDAMKRCAINLGTQFGLGLYDNGTTADVVKKIVGRDETPDQMTPEQEQMLQQSLGAQPMSNPANTPDDAADQSDSVPQYPDGPAAGQ